MPLPQQKGLTHVAAASERYRLALEACANAERAKDEARSNYEEVMGSAYRSGAEIEELLPFHYGAGTLDSYLARQRRELDRRLNR